jgi:hypothetical protein
VATYYVKTLPMRCNWPDSWAASMPELEGELSVSFDPSWNEFLSLYAAIHRNDRPEEVLAS